MAKLPDRPDHPVRLNTDHAWEAWGQRDPYYGVITDRRFRRDALTDDAKREFFASGDQHAGHVLEMIRKYVAPGFQPARVLDFGCGVGRLLVPFSRLGAEVTGADVSASMLAEARLNCDKLGATSVNLVATDDALTGIAGPFDLIHSYIVFQHIPPARGRALFARLLTLLSPRGVAAIHVSYSKRWFASTRGLEPSPPPLPRIERLKNAWRAPPPPGTPQPEPEPSPAIPADAGGDPDMHMFPYSMTELMFALQSSGVREMHVEFTDHGGEMGAFLFFRAPAVP